MIPPELLLEAYARGIFPMGMPDGTIGWFSPDPRGLIPIDDRFHVPRGLRRELKKGRFEIRVDTAFREVMEACAERKETWINREILASYEALHRIGAAHSLEAWSGGRLAGGLYGVALRGAFFGESMFHRETGASGAALVALVERLRARRFLLLDTQWITPHLQRFGAYEVPRPVYESLLGEALRRRVAFA